MIERGKKMEVGCATGVIDVSTLFFSGVQKHRSPYGVLHPQLKKTQQHL